jgi:hypothetical protein
MKLNMEFLDTGFHGCNAEVAAVFCHVIYTTRTFLEIFKCVNDQNMT